MIYVALRSADQAIERVHNRKKLGGHDVPEAKIRARWKGSLDNLGRFTPLADRLLAFSNASDEGNAVLIARKRRGVLEIVDPDSLPEITQRLSPFLAKL